jgi:prevent-host-death family protein
MQTVNVHAAKTHFSSLLARVQAGEEIVIARAGEPIARLLPYTAHAARRPDTEKGALQVAEDFDAPLPEELLLTFEGRS